MLHEIIETVEAVIEDGWPNTIVLGVIWALVGWPLYLVAGVLDRINGR